MVSHQMHPFYSIRPQMVFCSLLEHLENHQHVKKMQILCSVYRSCKNGFIPNAFFVFHWTPNDMFGCLFGAFRKPSACKKMQNLCFMPDCSIWCTEVEEMISHQMHPFYSTVPKMMFGCVLEHLWNLQHEKDAKLVFGVPKLRKWFRIKCIHSTPFYPKWCLIVFWAFTKPSACKNKQNLWFGPKWTILVYRSCGTGFTPNASILLHWTQNDVW
jgi:hypothetical protein